MCCDDTPFHYQKYIFLKVDCVDYRNLNVPEQNALIYVCGDIMEKCLCQHLCNICIEYAKIQKHLDSSFLLCHFKTYEKF